MHQAAYHRPMFSMQQDYSLYSGGVTFEGVSGTDFGLGSAPMPIKGMPAGKSQQQWLCVCWGVGTLARDCLSPLAGYQQEWQQLPSEQPCQQQLQDDTSSHRQLLAAHMTLHDSCGSQTVIPSCWHMPANPSS